MGRIPRSPLAVFEHTGVAGHSSLTRDHFAYYDLATDHQQRAHDIVLGYHALTVSRVEHSNSALSDALRPIPKFAVGGWVWVYSKAATIRRGTKMDTDAKVLKSKLSINWTSPYKSSQLAPVTRITPRTVPLLPLSLSLIHI